MRLLWAATLLASSLICVQAAGYTCPSGKSRKVVTLKTGDTFDLETQSGDTYGKNVKCLVKFKRAKRNKCDLNFSCSSFALTAVKPTCKGKSDFFRINRKRYCEATGPEVLTTKGVLNVLFKTNKKSQGGAGASCTATCVARGATTAAPPATTAAPPATTASPATAPTTAPPTTLASTTAPACTNCTTTDGRACQFPFFVNGQQYDRCTMDYTSEGESPWCATKVDGSGTWLNLQGEPAFGYCSTSCPTDQPSSPAGPACPHREFGFPASCAERQARTHKNILFLGNSYTYYNDLKSVVKNLAELAGFSATVAENTAGGVTMEWHATNSLEKIRGGDWDVVVLQDQSQRPSFGAQYVYYNIIPDTVTLVNTIKETNPCTLPLFFQTWGKRDGDTGNCANGATALCTYEGVQDQLTQAYSTFAYVNQPAAVAPAGEAWRSYTDRNSLFAGDGSHPSVTGTFLTACTIFEQIWGVPAPHTAHANALLMAQATLVVNQEQWSWPGDSGPPCAQCLG